MNRKALVYLVFLSVLFSLTALTSFARTPTNQSSLNHRSLDLDNPEIDLATTAGRPIDLSTKDDARLSLPEGVKFDTGQMADTGHLSRVEGEETCSQILVNNHLDVVEIGGGLGTAEPWVILDDIVYYTTDVFISPDYSLFLADGDTPDDPSPNFDTFGQAFVMPDNLTSVTVDYYTLQIDQDWIPYDRIFGEFWSLDEDGFLQDPLLFWEFAEYDDELWHPGTVFTTNPDFLNLLEGQELALLFYNSTDEVEPYELAVFDNIFLTVCFETQSGGPESIYLPTMISQFSVGPTCFPPTENPPDTFDSNRGFVETGATCNTTMSSLDIQDYYTFLTNLSGDYTFSLSNLPNGSEWSITVFVDSAPYPIADANTCRTTQPGDGNKSVTCTLPANGDFFIKVSAGGWAGVTENYTMQVTRP